MTDASNTRRRTVRPFVRNLASSRRMLLVPAVGCIALIGALFLLSPAPSSAQSPAQSPTQPAGQPTPVTYSVQAGETLSQIAKSHGVAMEDLMRVNGIPNADAIYVGQELRLPLGEAAAGVKVHEVAPGEGLLEIAREYDMDIRAIMRANNIANPNGIVAGQELIIPDTLIPSSEAVAASADASQSSASAAAASAEPVSRANAGATPESANPESASPASAATYEPEQIVHTVLAGETASGIAKRFGVPLADLLRYNGIANADLIRIGADLVIPPQRATPTATSMPPAKPSPTSEPAPTSEEGSTQSGSTQSGDVAETTDAPQAVAMADAPAPAAPAAMSPEDVAALMPEKPATTLNREYTVVRGDTIPAIALRLGVDADALRDLNAVVDDVRLVAGQTLLLPATDRELRVVTDEKKYVVQPGDSMSAIASRNDVTLADLMTANGKSNPNMVSVGEELVIPGIEVTGDGPLTRVGPARTGYYYYTVQVGDTLSELSQSFNVPRLALLKYNNLPNEETVYTGMELRVPYGAPEIPRRLPPVPISGSRFLVSLSRQQCWVYAGREVLYSWNCSTGIEDRRTKTGNFFVQSKIDNAKSNVWRLDMPYWLGIYNVGKVENGIHGLPVSWATGKKIWSSLIGQPATFGCAMLGDEDAKTLFDLAYIGMPVHIIQ